MRRLGPLRLILAALALTVTAIATAGAIEYQDSASTLGVDHQLAGEVHPADSEIWPAFPEALGSGACFADFDGDGFDDLYLVDQRYNPKNPATWDWGNETNPTNALFLNDGDGTFTRVDSGAESAAFGYGCSAADYDADGDIDIYVTNFGANELFENTGNGTFVNATDEVGVSGQGACPQHRCTSTSSAWADVDGDGDLDLYVANYVDTNLTDEHDTPAFHQAQQNFLFENQGDGTFEEVARRAGVAGNPTDLAGSKSLGVVFLDHDRDGDLDLYVANDERANDFYDNDGDGTFTERSDDARLADTRAGMGVTAGDYDSDGYEDLFFTHFSREDNGFYHNEQDGTFQDRSGEDELVHGREQVGWGTDFADVDRDGDLDLLAANGHVTHTEPRPYGQPTQLFLQQPDPVSEAADVEWTDATSTGGSGLVDQHVSRGLATADLEYDGDTDVAVVNNANASLQLLEASGVDAHWITVRLSQPGDNPNAIGAWVEVTANGATQGKRVRAGSSYLSQHSLALNFGLGEASIADEIAITWPDGSQTSVRDVASDQVVRVGKYAGLVEDTLAPVTKVLVDGPEGDNGWFTGPVSVTLDATDRATGSPSGIAQTLVRVDDAEWREHEGPIALGEGVHTIDAKSTDRAGNDAPSKGRAVRVDATPPVPAHTLNGTRGNAGWFTSEHVNVTLTASDRLSGVAGIEYRVDGESWQAYEGRFAVEGDGEHTLEYQARDAAGNRAATEHVTVKIDTSPPNVTLTRPDRGHAYVDGEAVLDAITGPATVASTGASDNFEVAARASDATSGVHAVDFARNATLVRVDDEEPYTWTWTIREEPVGVHQVSATARDVAGNTATDARRVVLTGNATYTLESGPAVFAQIGPTTLAPSTPWPPLSAGDATPTFRFASAFWPLGGVGCGDLEQQLCSW